MKSKVLSSVSLLMGLCLVLGSCLDNNETTPVLRMQEEIAKIDAYLAANPPDADDFIVKDASGIRMVITERPEVDIDGTEPIPLPPTQENRITVDYKGRLFTTGEQFDANTSFTFTLTDKDACGANGCDDVIDGWKTALGMMYQGMKATVYIPSFYAYGTDGNQGTIPGNAILVFDLHLKLVETDDQEPQLTNDKLAIANKLDGQNVNVHPNGLTYTYQLIGVGARPDLYDQVEIKYTGKLLDGTVFAEGFEQGPTIGFSSRPVNYIHGFGLGLQLMQEGGKATFYIPSALAYGIHSSTSIPANSNLIFEVELVNVTPNEE